MRRGQSGWHPPRKAGARHSRGGAIGPVRRGGVLIVVVAIAAIAGVLTLVLVRHLLLLERQQRIEERVVQADWLVRSALARGLRLARRDPQATGEVWEVPESEPEIPPGTTATIDIRRGADAARTGEVTVTVVLPGGAGRTIQREGRAGWGDER